jgi:hypothetical protein
MPTLIISNANAAAQCHERVTRLGQEADPSDPGCRHRISTYAALPHVKAAHEILPRIDRAEWPERIRDGKGTFLYDLTQGKLPPHDQGNTNYCWAHGSVRAVEILRRFSGQAPLLLSAESVAVPVTGGRNRGGSPDEALYQIQTAGACAQTFWPLNDRDQANAKPGWQQNALKHAIISWLDVATFDDQMTLALHRIPVAIGLGWWGHLVCQLEPVQLGQNEFGVGFDNSWGADYGDNGHAILDEEHATADLGAFAPISETFSDL